MTKIVNIENDDINDHLFEAASVGDIEVSNRVFMAPLTRARSNKDGHVQTGLHALYYAQRASAGLIVSEATQISPQGQGYAWTPGIYSDEQVESWRTVTDAVHVEGGRIVCQLWHVGAISHNVFQPDGKAPVSSSEFQPQGDAFVGDYHESGPMVKFPRSRELSIDDIKNIMKDYQNAAKCALNAGFDGVELHAGNGYLIDQFFRDSVNKRKDKYGGSIENRMRFMHEALDAIEKEIPSSKIGIRLSPVGGAGGSYDSNPSKLYSEVAKSLSTRNLAYLHVVRPNTHTAPNSNDNLAGLLNTMKENFGGFYISSGMYSPDEAEHALREKQADAIAFGRLFLSNPDLPRRIKCNDTDFNFPNTDTYYGGGHEGYTDYHKMKTTDFLPKN